MATSYKPSAKLLKTFKRMFKCDTVELQSPLNQTVFLIIGFKRHTSQDAKEGKGQWIKDGKPYDFEYVERQVIAHGDNDAELLKSARWYKKCLTMSMEDYLTAVLTRDHPLSL